VGAIGEYDKTLRLWTCPLAGKCGPSRGHKRGVQTVAFSPEAVGAFGELGQDHETVGRVHWREISTFEGHTSVITSVTFSPDGRRVLSGVGQDHETMGCVHGPGKCGPSRGTRKQSSPLPIHPMADGCCRGARTGQ